MGEKTGISYTHHTRQYWMGCTRVGPGCGLPHSEAGEGGGCYAELASLRWGKDLWGDDKARLYTGDNATKAVRAWNRKAKEAGERRRVFINTFSDVLDHKAEQAWRNKIMDDADACDWLDILLLTKRIGNARRMLPAQLPRNVWLGITAVDSLELHRDTDKLLRIDARVHWLSNEPGLGALSERDLPLLQGYQWIVWGGESGNKARVSPARMARALCDWRQDGQLPPLFMKQFGQRHARAHGWRSLHGADPLEWPAWAQIQEFPQAA